jgi:hypothetical protein
MVRIISGGVLLTGDAIATKVRLPELLGGDILLSATESISGRIALRG